MVIVRFILMCILYSSILYIFCENSRRLRDAVDNQRFLCLCLPNNTEYIITKSIINFTSYDTMFHYYRKYKQLNRRVTCRSKIFLIA